MEGERKRVECEDSAKGKQNRTSAALSRHGHGRQDGQQDEDSDEMDDRTLTVITDMHAGA